jgi:hypothetical protein
VADFIEYYSSATNVMACAFLLALLLSRGNVEHMSTSVAPEPFAAAIDPQYLLLPIRGIVNSPGNV